VGIDAPIRMTGILVTTVIVNQLQLITIRSSNSNYNCIFKMELHVTVTVIVICVEGVYMRCRYGADWRIWELQQQHEQEHSWCIEDDLTTFGEDNGTWNCSSQVWINKRCAIGAKRSKVENRAYAPKIANVVLNCMRDRRDVIFCCCRWSCTALLCTVASKQKLKVKTSSTTIVESK